MDKAARYLPSPSLSFLLFESIDQFDSGEEPGPFFVMLDGLHTEGCGNVALSGPRTANQDNVVCSLDELTAMKLPDQSSPLSKNIRMCWNGALSRRAAGWRRTGCVRRRSFLPRIIYSCTATPIGRRLRRGRRGGGRRPGWFVTSQARANLMKFCSGSSIHGKILSI